MAFDSEMPQWRQVKLIWTISAHWSQGDAMFVTVLPNLITEEPHNSDSLCAPREALGRVAADGVTAGVIARVFEDEAPGPATQSIWLVDTMDDGRSHLPGGIRIFSAKHDKIEAEGHSYHDGHNAEHAGKHRHYD